MQYRETLPLKDHEVVLTFDDGPLPPYTNRMLDMLAEQCVKATFFMVGRMARAYPRLVRRIHAEGHTIGTHSQNHPLAFDQMPVDTRCRTKSRTASLRSAQRWASRARRRRSSAFRACCGSHEVENYLQSRGHR